MMCHMELPDYRAVNCFGNSVVSELITSRLPALFEQDKAVNSAKSSAFLDHYNQYKKTSANLEELQAELLSRKVLKGWGL